MDKGLPRSSEGMENEFVPILDSKDLESWLRLSTQQQVVIFKHSVTCPISAAAYREMSKLHERVGIVVVQSSKDVSREIEARTGIAHESPQAIIINNGEPVWSASHWKVTCDAIATALLEKR